MREDRGILERDIVEAFEIIERYGQPGLAERIENLYASGVTVEIYPIKRGAEVYIAYGETTGRWVGEAEMDWIWLKMYDAVVRLSKRYYIVDWTGLHE